jgi:hypothetical protein
VRRRSYGRVDALHGSLHCRGGGKAEPAPAGGAISPEGVPALRRGASKPCRTKPVSAGVSDVRARGVSCKQARRVARTYYRTHEVPGWQCRERQLDLDYFRARCTRRDAVVRFAYGS